jgi:uncharacterized membrane protein YhaH (DUF805 family)
MPVSAQLVSCRMPVTGFPVAGKTAIVCPHFRGPKSNRRQDRARMGTFSIWHWLIVLLVILMPVIAVATERSGKKLPRRKFALWIAAWVAVFLLSHIPAGAIGIIAVPVALVLLLAWCVAVFFFYRAIVQRLRDAGHGKALGFVAIVPMLGLLVIAYLLFKPAAESPGQTGP